MGNLTIFRNQTAVTNTGRRELSDFSKSLTSTLTTRRIQTNTNGTFKRIVNGEQIGNAVRGEINVIIVNALPKVSRTFYAGAYDPNEKPTLPDCWSNLGDKPEAASPNKQSNNCADCKQNIAGSGSGQSKACRFQRRVAVMLEGDPSTDLYQFNIPAKSLFGKGTGNTHPFESYKNYLLANGFNVEGVVTNISYNLNADSMELLFSPVRELSDEEWDIVQEAKERPEAKQYVALTVAQTDGATSARNTEKASPVVQEEADDEPVKRPSKKLQSSAPKGDAVSSAIAGWADDDE
jgi:hypothetical protein